MVRYCRGHAERFGSSLSLRPIHREPESGHNPQKHRLSANMVSVKALQCACTDVLVSLPACDTICPICTCFDVSPRHL
jgi:hypothetical protein